MFGSWGWFTLTELQERLRLNSRAVARKHIIEKLIPYAVFGREILITNEDFDAWLKANATTGKRRRESRKAPDGAAPANGDAANVPTE